MKRKKLLIFIVVYNAETTIKSVVSIIPKKSNLTLIGRTKGKGFIALSGFKRIIYDTK